MAAKMINVILALVMALTLAAQSATADARDLYTFCRRINEEMENERSSWTTSISAYETAMKQFKSLSGASSDERRELADAWRAVTHDEPCSSKSLAYVHSIFACRPSANPSQKHLDEDVRKYAKKCLTAEYIGKEFAQYAGADLEKFLTSDLLAAYRAATPIVPKIHFRQYLLLDHLYEPERAEVLAGAVKRDFPREAAQLSGSSKMVENFLTKHLYKPCASYVKRVDKIIYKIEAGSYYAFGEHFGRLPREVQDALYRFKICVNFEIPERVAKFTNLMAGHF